MKQKTLVDFSNGKLNICPCCLNLTTRNPNEIYMEARRESEKKSLEFEESHRYVQDMRDNGKFSDPCPVLKLFLWDEFKIDTNLLKRLFRMNPRREYVYSNDYQQFLVIEDREHHDWEWWAITYPIQKKGRKHRILMSNWKI